jgi:hypothetical protein
MAQEFTINSSDIESKINQLLPSQGGRGAGVDFTASTMVIPIVDLTETAEGSDVRPDLQTALSFGSITEFTVFNAVSDIIVNTGYWRIFGAYSCNNDTGTFGLGQFRINDGTTNKNLIAFYNNNEPNENSVLESFDFNVFLEAGHSVNCVAQSNVFIYGCTRQIADISGNLINP